jgi:hypothetical protein
MIAALGRAYAVAGGFARRILEELSRPGTTQYISPYELGLIREALYEKDEMWRLLDRAADEHSGWLPYLKCEPRLAHLHSDEHSPMLLRRIGL